MALNPAGFYARITWPVVSVRLIQTDALYDVIRGQGINAPLIRSCCTTSQPLQKDDRPGGIVLVYTQKN